MNTNLETQSDKRNIGVDLLRLVATFMIVVLHVLRGSVSENSTLYVLAESFLLCCFNTIALIAGYVFCTGKFRLGRVFRLWGMAIFYSIIFYLVAAIVNREFSVIVLIKCFFPVQINRFWFFTAYILVLLLMPVFNYAIEKLPRKAYLAGLIFFAVFFSVIQFASSPWWVDSGKSAIWLAYLYFVGAYLKKYGFLIRKWWLNLPVYLGSSALSFCYFLLSNRFNIDILDEKYTQYAHYYCSLFALIGAMALFAFFAQMPVKQSAERVMRYFSSHAFGIYLLHSSLIICSIRLLYHPQWTPIEKMLVILAYALAVFLCSFIIEAVRRLLFRVSRLDALADALGEKIQNKLEKEKEKE